MSLAMAWVVIGAGGGVDPPIVPGVWAGLGVEFAEPGGAVVGNVSGAVVDNPTGAGVGITNVVGTEIVTLLGM